MTPAAYVKSVLVKQLGLVPELSVNHIHTFLIPEDDTTTDVPIVVISELPDAGIDFGNDNPLETYKRIQIQFYYPRNYDEDMDGIESAVKQILWSSGIRKYDDAGHIMTPDSKNIMNTLKFNYTKEES